MNTVELILAEVAVAATQVATGAGVLTSPGHRIPEKRIQIDPDFIRRVIVAAREAAKSAYAPYSKFRVGTAVVMADDPDSRIFAGANVENSSYGATVCAERTGLFHCAALGFRRLRYIGVSTLDALNLPLSERSPCGICRQAIKEFAGRDIATDDALILIDNGDPEMLCEVFDIERLLPYGFNFSRPAASVE